jgi:UMF1 family MFS transporter
MSGPTTSGRLSRLNPFASLPNGREVWAWGMYDLANQSFQLIINTLLFGLYVTKVLSVSPSSPEGSPKAWSLMIAIATLIVVVLSPIVGALADQRAWKRELLLGTGLVCAILTACLAIAAPGQLWIAGAIYITAAVACGLGENFLASFLPEISSRDKMAYVSAVGFAMSYLAALILLGITAAVVFGFGRGELAEARPLLIFSGLWFLAGIIPAWLYLKERATPQPRTGKSILVESIARLADSARHARRYRQLVRFLAIFFFYSLGTQTVIYLASVITTDLGFTFRDNVLFFLQLTLVAGLAAVLIAKYQHRLGGKRTVMLCLGVWGISTAALAIAAVVYNGKPPAWVIWTTGNGLGFGLGGIGTASRALVGVFTPPERSGEFFGLWGMVYKSSAVVGVPLFSMVFAANRPLALGMLSAFFIIGLVLMVFCIDEQEGIEASGGGTRE